MTTMTAREMVALKQLARQTLRQHGIDPAVLERPPNERVFDGLSHDALTAAAMSDSVPQLLEAIGTVGGHFVQVASAVAAGLAVYDRNEPSAAPTAAHLDRAAHAVAELLLKFVEDLHKNGNGKPS